MVGRSSPSRLLAEAPQQRVLRETVADHLSHITCGDRAAQRELKYCRQVVARERALEQLEDLGVAEIVARKERQELRCSLVLVSDSAFDVRLPQP
jgi:hypothetical protein